MKPIGWTVTLCLFSLSFLSPPIVSQEPPTSLPVEEESNKTKIVLTGNPQIDYIHDPNLPSELHNFDLSEFPFYQRVPNNIDETNFTCDGRFDGFYTSIPHKCQVYHNCQFGIKYDFLCPNYTAFDQANLICNYYNVVDCDRSSLYYHRNENLYIEPTPSTTSAPEIRIVYIDRPHPRKPPGNRGRPNRRPPPASATDDYYYDYVDETPVKNKTDDYYYYDELPVVSTTTRRPPPRRRPQRTRQPAQADRFIEEIPDEAPSQKRVRDRVVGTPTRTDEELGLTTQSERQPVEETQRRRRPQRRRRKKKTTTTTAAPEYEYYDEYYDYYEDEATTTTTTLRPKIIRRRKRPPIRRRTQPTAEDRRQALLRV